MYKEQDESINKQEQADQKGQEEQKEQEPQEQNGTKELEAKIQELQDKILREKAENENIRRRLSNELKDTQKYAISNFAKDLLEISENLHRAIESIPTDLLEQDDGLSKKIFEGVQMTKQSLENCFNQHGIKRLYPQGEKFDHNYHQAISQVEDAENEPNTVIQVVQAGYTLHDRLLRPAMVVVSKSG